MFNLDDITDKNNKEHNEKWPNIPYHPYIILIIGARKTYVSMILISQQSGIDRIYLYPKDLSEPKYGFLIKKREDVGIKHFNYQKVFIECSNAMDDVYEKEERERKILIAFDDMIANIMSNKKCQAVIKELFFRCRKLNISFVFITQSYFSVSKDVRINSIHFMIMKINNKK